MSEFAYIVRQHTFNRDVGLFQVPIVKRTKSRVKTTACQGTGWKTTHYADQFDGLFSKTPEEAIARWREVAVKMIENCRDEIKKLEASLTLEAAVIEK